MLQLIGSGLSEPKIVPRRCLMLQHLHTGRAKTASQAQCFCRLHQRDRGQIEPAPLGFAETGVRAVRIHDTANPVAAMRRG
jgi:hypothetical protein